MTDKRIATVCPVAEAEAIGKVAEIFDDPQHDYTKHLLAAEPKGTPPAHDPAREVVMEADNLKVWFPVKVGLLRKTVDHVKELSLILSDGDVVTVGPLSHSELDAKLHAEGLEGKIYNRIKDILETNASEVEDHYPRIMRRVSGYNLEQFLGDRPVNMPVSTATAPDSVNLPRS